MPRARESFSLIPTDYEIAGNTIRAYRDVSHKLVFVLDETINADKPNVLLVIDSFDGRKWDDVLANDYHVDLETVRPKRDNKYQKLDIEYGGLDVYADLIGAYDADDDLEDALENLAQFRAMSVRRSATERLSAAEETINKSQETIERTNETINELRAKIKELRNRLTKQRGDIGREPTKASAAKILKTEAQIDATNEKLNRAKKRVVSAQRRLASAEDDAEIARAILARDVPNRPTKRKPSMPVVQKPQPVAVRDEPDVKETEYEEDEEDEEVKPLFDKDPENLDDSIAFKPIDFASTELPKPNEKLITSDVDDDEELAPAPLSFTPPVRDDVDVATEKQQTEPVAPVLDSLTPVTEPDEEPIVSQLQPVTETPKLEPEPVETPMPIAPISAARPLSPVTNNIAPVNQKTQKSTLMYYIMLVLLIILSIGTLWIYQKTTAENVPDLVMPAPEMAVTPDLVAQQPVVAEPVVMVTETPTPFVASVNVVAVEEPAVVEPEPVVVIEQAPVVIEPEPIVEPEPEPEPIIEGSDESPFITPEPVVAYEPEVARIPTEAEVMASKPGYNVSQNEQMFVAAEDYDTEEIESVCEGGAAPDSLGCCPGESYTYTEDGFMCCNSVECFPPAGN